MRILFFISILLLIPTNSFSQTNDELNESAEQFEELSENLNKISLGWAYYGRGNGISIIYDREIFEFWSQGIGIEEYFEDDEIETSFFLVTEVPIQKYLNLNSSIEIYPGIEYGSFGGEFETHPFFGFSYSFDEKIGIYTEIGSRGVLGLFFKF